MARMLTEDDVARLRLDLLRKADRFDDPEAYGAGIDDALEAIFAMLFESDVSFMPPSVRHPRA